MEQSKQLVSRELAERMKAMGFPQASVFWYKKIYEFDKETSIVQYDEYEQQVAAIAGEGYPEHCSAYSVAELGEMIKYITPKDFVDAYMEVMDFTEEIFKKEPIPCMIVNLMTQPDIPAQMLIWLAEQGIINPKEIKI